jgi:predicted membrane-bound spermidine synthase
MTLLFILVPLLLRARSTRFKGSGPSLVFFASIGLGFMLVEVSQLQRLNIFLGHPTYSLSVVLFALLLSSGLGSLATQYVAASSWPTSGKGLLAVLLAVLLAFGLLTPWALQMFKASSTPIRILVGIAILSPMGFFMGMAFPIGMRLISARSPALTPWLWGINGATSVCGSVMAVIIAMGMGISSSFWTGVACYGLALIALHRVLAQDAAETRSVSSTVTTSTAPATELR